MDTRHISRGRLREAFGARAAGSPSPDLQERIRLAVLRTRQISAWVRTSAITFVVALAIVAGIALRGGSQPSDAPLGPSPTPAESRLALVPASSTESASAPESAAEPSVSATPVRAEPAAPSDPVAYAPGPVEVDGLARVVATDGLRIRSAPSVADTSRRLEPLAPVGLLLVVVDGPVSADGYEWYLVEPRWRTDDLGGESGADLATFGWVAAGSRDGEPWIQGLSLDCPPDPSGTELIGMGRYVGLVCYGKRELTITSGFVCFGYDISGGSAVFEGPSWTDDGGRGCLLWADPSTEPDGLTDYSRAVWIAGEAVRRIPDRGTFHFTGHFDDPGSRECRLINPELGDPSPAEVLLWCRLHFVVVEAEPAP